MNKKNNPYHRLSSWSPFGRHSPLYNKVRNTVWDYDRMQLDYEELMSMDALDSRRESYEQMPSGNTISNSTEEIALKRALVCSELKRTIEAIEQARSDIEPEYYKIPVWKSVSDRYITDIEITSEYAVSSSTLSRKKREFYMEVAILMNWAMAGEENAQETSNINQE